MNWQKRLPVVLTLVTLASVARMLAQQRFEIPITITDGHLSWSMYFGILPGANFCMAPQDTINGHGEWEPTPVPPGPLEAWFVWPRSGSNLLCFGMGIRNDYRPFTSYTQKDTFRVDVYYILDSANLVVSWPSGLAVLQRVDTQGCTNWRLPAHRQHADDYFSQPEHCRSSTLQNLCLRPAQPE